MTKPRYRVERLTASHRRLRQAFSCGVPELDAYLHDRAGQDMRRNVAVVWVLYDAQDDAIAGYYTLSAASVETTAVPEGEAGRLPRYPHLPVILLGRLAVSSDPTYRGRGLGGVLLVDALKRAAHLRDTIGAVAVVVDAKDVVARGFYEHYGFQRPQDSEWRLFISMGTIETL